MRLFRALSNVILSSSHHESLISVHCLSPRTYQSLCVGRRASSDESDPFIIHVNMDSCHFLCRFAWPPHAPSLFIRLLLALNQTAAEFNARHLFRRVPLCLNALQVIYSNFHLKRTFMLFSSPNHYLVLLNGVRALSAYLAWVGRMGNQCMNDSAHGSPFPAEINCNSSVRSLRMHCTQWLGLVAIMMMQPANGSDAGRHVKSIRRTFCLPECSRLVSHEHFD